MIVVGVDGSDGGRRALRFALAEAALRNCPVEAVRILRPGDDTALAEHELWTDVEAVRREVPGAPGVSEDVRTGDPAQVLIERSATAALLVVGSHGTSSLIHSALGSVSNACAQLAHCPVVVLPRSLHSTGVRSQQEGTSARSGGE
jgi:nucleotide-binding universal stress UspA family protein